VSKTSVDWWPQRVTLPFIDYILGILIYAWAGNPQYWGNSGYIVCFNLGLYILTINDIKWLCPLISWAAILVGRLPTIGHVILLIFHSSFMNQGFAGSLVLWNHEMAHI
jgi:hypothetical protein